MLNDPKFTIEKPSEKLDKFVHNPTGNLDQISPEKFKNSLIDFFQ
jgi:hypothetical protein